jgi:hypothetical protein|tara:strand:- start:716 stop:880 length:165 start_codon:yes stop_codon:yes gene_type:complete
MRNKPFITTTSSNFNIIESRLRSLKTYGDSTNKSLVSAWAAEALEALLESELES